MSVDRPLSTAWTADFESENNNIVWCCAAIFKVHENPAKDHFYSYYFCSLVGTVLSAESNNSRVVIRVAIRVYYDGSVSSIQCGFKFRFIGVSMDGFERICVDCFHNSCFKYFGLACSNTCSWRDPKVQS
jgi:hypothetical protein